MPANSEDSSADKAPSHRLYRELRQMSAEQLWQHEVPRFNRGSARERVQRVAVIRAVAAVVGEKGDSELRLAAREWVRSLLSDPEEKVRRYAMNALPKLGGSAEDEQRVIRLAARPTSELERRQASKTLGLIGGGAAVQALAAISGADSAMTRQKIEARLARGRGAALRLEARLAGWRGMEVSLYSRQGLEEWVADEVKSERILRRCSRLLRVSPGECRLAMTGAFSLADLLQSRCFEMLGIHLGAIPIRPGEDLVGRVAELVASSPVEALLRSATEGALRYRASWGPDARSKFSVGQLAEAVFQRNPRLLNDSKQSLWNLVLRGSPGQVWVELAPKLVPDPRRPFRSGYVPAASHPPLASALARLAGAAEAETVWDPFCGSGLELIECVLLGGVKRVVGSDLKPEALDVARRNLEAAQGRPVQTELIAGDFREVAARELRPESVDVVITNPPLGMRVRVDDLRGLLAELLAAAAVVLRPGGRLVFPNPVRGLPIPAGLELDHSRPVDMGGFRCHLERYWKR